MNKKKTIKEILSYLKPYKIYIIFAIACAFVSVTSVLLIPIYIGKAIDLIIGQGNVDFGGILKNIYIISLLMIITFISQWCMSILNNLIIYNYAREIRKKTFEKILKLPLSYLDKNPHGEILTKVVNDIDIFTEGLLMTFTQFFTGVLMIFGTLIFLLRYNWIIALLVVFLTPLSLLVAKFIAKKIQVLLQEQNKIKTLQVAYIDEMISNLKVVQIFSQEEESLHKFKGINNKLEVCSLKALFFSSLVNPTTRFINALIYAFVALAGAYVIIKRPLGLSLTIGSLSALLAYANLYTKPFNEISGVMTELQNALVCAERIFLFLEESDEKAEKETALALDNVKGDISLEKIDFSYHVSRNLIKNFNLQVKKGQRIAIVGPTGSGKTTIINLLMRFYEPDSGSISIDGKNITEVKRNSLRNNYGMVLQETWLKTDTIYNNLKLGKEDATLEEVIIAAKKAHAHDFIVRLKEGYQTIISENGDNLSIGEKQLLCVARVMLKMPPVLILDEATSNIDTRTEIKIQKAFSQLMEGKTTFIVAHRLKTVQEADLILVMKDGSIIEKGNHQELILRKGFYYQLYHSQFDF